MKEVRIDVNVETIFNGVFDNCHMGCDSCDFVPTVKTKYENGKVVGLRVNVRCENVDLCEHLVQHLARHPERIMG